jgi:Trk K+ transport system NAD-binding subunit
MAAQIAQKIFGLKQVIAKVNDPVRAQTYREMGINTFSRTTILGTLLHAMLQDDREVGEVLMRKALAHEADMVHEPAKAR